VELFLPVLLLPPILTALHAPTGMARCIFSGLLFLFGMKHTLSE